jgi:hypothetical protein
MSLLSLRIHGLYNTTLVVVARLMMVAIRLVIIEDSLPEAYHVVGG